MLKRLLKSAKQGRLQGFAIATLNSEGYFGTAYTGSVHQNIYGTVGVIEALKARFIKEKNLDS